MTLFDLYRTLGFDGNLWAGKLKSTQLVFCTAVYDFSFYLHEKDLGNLCTLMPNNIITLQGFPHKAKGYDLLELKQLSLYCRLWIVSQYLGSTLQSRSLGLSGKLCLFVLHFFFCLVSFIG